MPSDEIHFQILRLVEKNPELTQRELARELRISLGSVNYCIRALLEKGYIKAINFTNSNNKRAYLYKLTPRGVAESALATRRFLARKEAEYKRLVEEIEHLRDRLAR